MGRTLYLTVFTHCVGCPTLRHGVIVRQVDSSRCPAQSFILRQLESQKLKAIHFSSLSTNICGAAPTCLVLTLLLPTSGLPRGGARAAELAGTTLGNRCRTIKLAIKSSNETFWKDTKQVKQRDGPWLLQGTSDTKYSRAPKVPSSDVVTELEMRN